MSLEESIDKLTVAIEKQTALIEKGVAKASTGTAAAVHAARGIDLLQRGIHTFFDHVAILRQRTGGRNHHTDHKAQFYRKGCHEAGRCDPSCVRDC